MRRRKARMSIRGSNERGLVVILLIDPSCSIGSSGLTVKKEKRGLIQDLLKNSAYL